MSATTLICSVVTDQRDALIRAEVLAGEKRVSLELAVVQAIRDCGVSVDEASEASGLRPSEIATLLAEGGPAADLAQLAGLR